MVQNNTVAADAYPYTTVADMDEAQFAKWVALLEQRTGIHLSAKRRSFLVTSLNIRMRELEIDNYDAYYQYLTAGRRGAIEWEILVDRLTIHETRFYRDENALSLIRDYYLPRITAQQSIVKLNAWSVGCATGEEPYSLAIMVDDYLASRGLQGYVGVTATDISSASLSTARKAIYPANRLSNLSEELRNEYFIALDKQRYQVIPRLQERICFTRLNLMKLSASQFGMMDIIMCQNVLIYFKRQQRIAILDHLVKHLKPGGLLILGAGEILDWENPLVENIEHQGTLAYQRIHQAVGCEV